MTTNLKGCNMKIKESQQERDAWDLQCYGCTVASLRKQLDGARDYTMLVASMLSDAQELISLDYSDDARQKLNVAKFVLFNYIAKDAE
jgi:hypothetical protein